MPEISWVSPPYVAGQLGQPLSTGGEDGDGNTTSGQPTGPGLHGSGLDGTSYGNVTLQPGTPNRLTLRRRVDVHGLVRQPGRERRVQRRGLGQDRAASGDGETITLTKTVDARGQGETVTVALPLTRRRRSARALDISVTVAEVPGEKKTDNNKSTYPALFDQG